MAKKKYKEFDLGKYVQEARLKKGWTQQQVCDKIGRSVNYMSMIERNDCNIPSRKVAGDICEALNLDIEKFGYII